MEFVQKFTPPDFQAKNFTPSISPNFNSFSGKNTKNAWKWGNLHCWQKFYTWQNGYFCQQICSKFNDLFMIEWLVSGSRQEMGKSTSVWRSPRSWLTFHSFLKCNGILWRRHALDYTSTGSGIILPRSQWKTKYQLSKFIFHSPKGIQVLILGNATFQFRGHWEYMRDKFEGNTCFEKIDVG